MATKTKFYKNTVIAGLAALSFILQIFHIGIASSWGMWIDFVAVPWIIAFFLLGVNAAFTTSIIMLTLISLIAASGVIGALMKFIATIPMFLIPAMLLFKKTKLMTSLTIMLIMLTSLGIVFTYKIIEYESVNPSEASEKTVKISKNLNLQAEFGGFKPASNLKNAIGSIILILSGTIIIAGFLLFSKGETKSLDFFQKPANMIIGLIIAVIIRGIITCLANYYFAIPAFFGMSTEQALAFIPWKIMFIMNAIQGIIEYGIAWILVFKTHIRERFGT